MARIRSVKPEFWSDRKLARVSRDARLLYIALWNLADEHGRLQGDARWMKGHVFPYDDDLTVDCVEWMLYDLAKLGRVEPYTVDGDPYLFLPKLAAHQRLEPGKSASRLPDPPAEPQPIRAPARVVPDAAQIVSDDSAQIVAQHVAGSMEHGAWSMEHGAGVPPSAAREIALRENPDTAQTLLGEWLDHCVKRPPVRVVGPVGQAIKAMLAEGIDAGDVRQGLAAWHGKGLHPSTLPSVVNEVMQGQARASPRQQADDAMFTRQLQRAQRGTT